MIIQTYGHPLAINRRYLHMGHLQVVSIPRELVMDHPRTAVDIAGAEKWTIVQVLQGVLLRAFGDRPVHSQRRSIWRRGLDGRALKFGEM